MVQKSWQILGKFLANFQKVGKFLANSWQILGKKIADFRLLSKPNKLWQA